MGICQIKLALDKDEQSCKDKTEHMARDLNKVLLIGNLTYDPEVRETPSGRSVCGFRIATKRMWNTKDGEKKEQAQYHRIVAWDQLSKICGKYLKKGRRVYIEGRLVNREYEKDSEKRAVTEIVAEDLILEDAKPTEVSAVASAPAVAPVDEEPSEIPF